MFHDTLSNLTKFLHSTEERIYSYLGKTRLILQTFFEFPGSGTWQSSRVMQTELKLILHTWELSLGCSSLSGLLSFFGFAFPTVHYSPEVSLHLCLSIAYLCRSLILYSPAGLTMPDKLWDCDGCYQNLFTFKKNEAEEITLFVQVLYGGRRRSPEDNSDPGRLLGQISAKLRCHSSNEFSSTTAILCQYHDG